MFINNRSTLTLSAFLYNESSFFRVFVPSGSVATFYSQIIQCTKPTLFCSFSIDSYVQTNLGNWVSASASYMSIPSKTQLLYKRCNPIPIRDDLILDVIKACYTTGPIYLHGSVLDRPPPTDSDSACFIGVGRHKSRLIQIHFHTVLHEVIVLLVDKLFEISFTARR